MLSFVTGCYAKYNFTYGNCQSITGVSITGVSITGVRVNLNFSFPVYSMFISIGQIRAFFFAIIGKTLTFSLIHSRNV